VTVDLELCNNPSNRRVVPNVVGLTKAAAVIVWASSGFGAGNLNAGSFPDTDIIVTQSVQAYTCANSNNQSMTITNVPA
jgi:hypothetical protein